MDGWMDGWINVSMYRWIKWSIKWWIDGLTDGSIDVLINGSMVRWFIAALYSFRWCDGSSPRSTSPAPSMPSPHSPPFLPHRAHMKSLLHDKSVPLPAVSVPSPHSPPFFPHIDWRPCRRQRELERVCVWDREWGFLHCRWKVNTFRDIVDCSQRKCKRKNWFLFYSFLWTCRETAKSKALKIVYRAYVWVLKGW